MTDPLETRITGVQEAHLQIRDAYGLVRCLCGGWLAVMPGGSPGDDRAHRAHVAAEIARALGAETRVEWGVNGSSINGLHSHGDREADAHYCADQWDGAVVSRTVTAIPPLVGDWQEADS